MGLDGFAVLTKKQEDLLKKGFCCDTIGLVTLNTTSGPLLFKSRASLRAGNSTVAKASIQYKKDQLTFTPKRKTDGNSMYVLEYAPNVDLKFKSECKVAHAPAPESVESTFSAEYSQPNYKVKFALTHPGPAAKFSATVGSEKLGVAVDGKFNLTTMRLENYNFANYWQENGCRLVLRHMGSNKTEIAPGMLEASYHQVVSDKTALAAVAKYSFPTKQTCIEFGGTHALSCCCEVRGKVTSTALACVGISKKFGNWKATVSTSADLKKVVQTGNSDYRMGVRVDLNA